MYSIPYEITALVARYILILLCAFVLMRSIFIARASRRHSKNKNQINVARLIAVDTNREYILGYDNTIGCSKRCDIQIYSKNIAKIHVQIYKKKDKWMLCTYTRRLTLLNEMKIGGSIQINSYDTLKLGNKDYRFIINKGDK